MGSVAVQRLYILLGICQKPHQPVTMRGANCGLQGVRQHRQIGVFPVAVIFECCVGCAHATSIMVLDSSPYVFAGLGAGVQ